MALSVEQIAMIVHDTNRAYCASLGDHTQVTWDMAPEWVKQSARSGVELLLRDSTVTPERSHEAWMAEKVAAGWKWGAVKAPDLLEHPCLLPYADLPAEQRRKDELFVTIVRILGDGATGAEATESTATIVAAEAKPIAKIKLGKHR